MTNKEAIELIDDRMCWGRGRWSEHHMPEIDEYWQAGLMAIEALKAKDYASERYADLCAFFSGHRNKGADILHSREEFKQWLERMRWHVEECDRLSKELDALKAQDAKDAKPMPGQMPSGGIVYRQDAIDALDEIETEVADGLGFQYEKWREYFSEMPSAQSDNRLSKIAELVEGTIDHFDLDDAMDLLYQIKDVLDGSDELPSAQSEQPEIIHCKYCKHRIENEHYGEKGYIDLKAMCELDTGDIFELGRHAEIDDWFCADAERRTDES